MNIRENSELVDRLRVLSLSGGGFLASRVQRADS